MKPFLTLLIPAYNEESRLSAALDFAADYLSGKPFTWEILVVDDGSRDGTPVFLESACRQRPSLRWVRHPVNQGKGAAVRTGLREAQGENILFCDADGATPLSEMEKMLPHASETGPLLITGSRTMKGAQVLVAQTCFRRFLSAGYRWLCRFFVTPGISDITCGFKWVNRVAADLLAPRMRTHGWSFDAEMFVIVRLHRGRIIQVPVAWSDQGKSKVRLQRDVVTSFTEVAAIVWRRWTGGYR